MDSRPTDAQRELFRPVIYEYILEEARELAARTRDRVQELHQQFPSEFILDEIARARWEPEFENRN